VRALGTVRSFLRRRIRVPVGRDALVLDVGSGDHPHWRADVLVDLMPDSASDHQRYKGASVRIDRPLFEADAASLPFATGVFDYAICTHVLEHVPRPDLVARELSRVATAGYVEVPRVGMAKILDLPSHLWYCRDRDGVLEFAGKAAVDFDDDISSFLRTSGLERSMARLFARSFDVCVIGVEWRGALPVRVVGAPSETVLRQAGASSDVGRSRRAPLAPLERALRRVSGRRAPVSWNGIVRADLQRERDEPLRPVVYRVEQPRS
jgi:hypothetical protein